MKKSNTYNYSIEKRTIKSKIVRGCLKMIRENHLRQLLLLSKQLLVNGLGPAAKTFAPATMPGKIQADFSQQYAADHIGNHVLPGKQRGQADEKCENSREDLIPPGNLLLTQHAPEADPTLHAVDGRKQIQGRV